MQVGFGTQLVGPPSRRTVIASRELADRPVALLARAGKVGSRSTVQRQIRTSDLRRRDAFIGLNVLSVRPTTFRGVEMVLTAITANLGCASPSPVLEHRKAAAARWGGQERDRGTDLVFAQEIHGESSAPKVHTVLRTRRRSLSLICRADSPSPSRDTIVRCSMQLQSMAHSRLLDAGRWRRLPCPAPHRVLHVGAHWVGFAASCRVPPARVGDAAGGRACRSDSQDLVGLAHP